MKRFAMINMSGEGRERQTGQGGGGSASCSACASQGEAMDAMSYLTVFGIRITSAETNMNGSYDLLV